MSPAFDPKKAMADLAWLKKHPHFQEKPASLKEFLGPGYLNIEALVRPGVLETLVGIFGEEVNGFRIATYERAMMTGGIGIGKTTFASIALPYMAHWTLCLKDPQTYFGLLPGSRIAFMQMSTSKENAVQVVFGDIFARIKNADWFVQNYPYDDKFTKQIRFAKDIWILPGDSTETSFEGYNILGGIIDEMDSHKQTKDKDYADVGYTTITSRVESRYPVFGDEGEEAGHRGLIICIGQMKKAVGFAARKYEEFERDPKAYTMRMSIWESFGWDRYTRKDGTRASFWYDSRRKQIISESVAEMVDNPNFIEIPNAYRASFENSPEKALRDLAGIPPQISSPFISLADKVDLCRDRWQERHDNSGSPVKLDPRRVQFEPWFKANGDPRKRHVHIDIAYSGDGDAAGLAMGYVESIVEMDGEKKPYIVFDALMRVKALPGTEIQIADLRRVVYQLKEDLGFKVISVTLDGFQSTDTMQQMRKKRYIADYLSVDRSTLPYEDLREAIYEERIEFPPYITYVNPGDDKQVEIAVKELLELQDVGKKIDHPVGGSKDVTDPMAAVVNRLMGDRTYRKGVTSISSKSGGESDDLRATGTTGHSGSVIQLPGRGMGLQAPIPPSTGGSLGLSIPTRLQPRRDK